MVLGRQPELGIAELESLYGPDKISIISPGVVLLDVDPCLVTFDRLGGSVKFCKYLTKLSTSNWTEIVEFLEKESPGHAAVMPPGKMRLGLSAIGFNISNRQLQASGLSIKKAIQRSGRSVRLVPSTNLELSTAQIIYNKLTSELGWDMICIKQGQETFIAQTVKVQDINAYAKRDRNRPKRDTRVGMLPPKLAQLIINLSVGILTPNQMQSICDIPIDQAVPRPQLGQTILDPFCGTGVILQEALLDGYEVYGTDQNPRMIDYTQANIDWLKNLHQINSTPLLEVADAANYKWKNNISFVASETTLGRPLKQLPPQDELGQIIADCNTIIKKFLQNIHNQIPSGTRLCLAVPAWQIRPNSFAHLPLIDQIHELGYNRTSFTHVRSETLVYYRSDQLVARELLVLTTSKH